MNALDHEITTFISKFSANIEPDLIDFCISYVHHGERAIAIETITSWICEREITITKNDFNSFCRLQELCCVPEVHRLRQHLEVLTR